MKGKAFWENLFGFNHAFIEESVETKEGSYKDLNPEALYTSYEDLEEIFSHLPVQGTWVDLGAGVGQSALMYGLLYPERKAIAVEFVHSRVASGQNVAQKLHLKNVAFYERDLLRDEIPFGDIYFLYFPTGPVLDRILHVLRQRQKNFFVVAIESHGDLLERLRKEKWLIEKKQIPLKTLRHHNEALVFEAKDQKDSDELNPHAISFLENYLEIREGEKLWLGESYGLEWLKEDLYDLKFPPRSIQWSQVEKILSASELSPVLDFTAKLRRLGEVKIMSKNGLYQGSIRKIYFYPAFRLEISSGEQVEWEEIQTIHWGQFLCYDSSCHFFSLPLVPTKS